MLSLLQHQGPLFEGLPDVCASYLHLTCVSVSSVRSLEHAAQHGHVHAVQHFAWPSRTESVCPCVFCGQVMGLTRQFSKGCFLCLCSVIATLHHVQKAKDAENRRANSLSSSTRSKICFFILIGSDVLLQTIHLCNAIPDVVCLSGCKVPSSHSNS